MLKVLAVGSFLFFISCTSLNNGGNNGAAVVVAPKIESSYLIAKQEVDTDKFIDSKTIISNFLLN